MKQGNLEILLKQDRKLFHTADLALLWEMPNRNSLYMAIYRMVKRGVLFPVHRGFYSVVPISTLSEISLGASFLHRYCYLSTETVLSQKGIILQAVYKTTFVSDVSKSFTIGGKQFLARIAKSSVLHNTTGIYQSDIGVLCADVDRAVADMLYFQPNYHFDNAANIDWDKVRLVQKELHKI